MKLSPKNMRIVNRPVLEWTLGLIFYGNVPAVKTAMIPVKMVILTCGQVMLKT